MFSTNIRLSTIENVKDFVSAINEYDFYVDLVQGKYCINGKSIMGIFSLDLSKPLALNAEVPEESLADFSQTISAFLAE